MPVDPVRAVIQSLGHAARKERQKGNESGATGLGLIAFGIFALPILPILGIPLIIMGIWKLCSKNSSA
jgi:hypothetical protein